MTKAKKKVSKSKLSNVKLKYINQNRNNKKQRTKEKKCIDFKAKKLHSKRMKAVMKPQKATKKPEKIQSGDKESNEEELYPLTDDNLGTEMQEMIDEEDFKYMMKHCKKGEMDDHTNVELGPDKKIKELLPFKTPDGIVRRKIVVAKEIPENVDQTKVKASLPETFELKELSVAQLLLQRKHNLHKRKLQMTAIAVTIREDHAAVNQLSDLIAMLDEKDLALSYSVPRLVAKTILQVFHTLIPSYKFRDTTKEEKLKKDTKKIIEEEQAIVSYYQTYLLKLEEKLKQYKDDPQHEAKTSVAISAAFCLSQLMKQHYHFNFGSNILRCLVPFLNCAVPEIRQHINEALAHLLATDKLGTLTAEIIRKVVKMIRSANYKVEGDALRPFCHIQIREMKNLDDERQKERQLQKALERDNKLMKKIKSEERFKKSRKEKKMNKILAKKRAKLEEEGFDELKFTRMKNNTAVLDQVFTIYFHILKRKPGSELISIVLEGLARFAHTINIEFFNDLLRLMNELLQTEALGRHDSLNCVKTVFAILSGQGEVLTISPYKFYVYVYDILNKWNTLDTANCDKDLLLLLEILQVMFHPRRLRVPPTILLAYVKRLCCLCLHLKHNANIPVFLTVKKIMESFSCTEALLDPLPEGCSGVYDPFTSEPEDAHATASALWELHIIKRHYHPVCCDLAKSVLSSSDSKAKLLSTLRLRTYPELLSMYSMSDMQLNPALPAPIAHTNEMHNKDVQFEDEEYFCQDVLNELKEKVLGERETCSDKKGEMDEKVTHGRHNKNKSLNNGIKEDDEMKVIVGDVTNCSTNYYSSCIQNMSVSLPPPLRLPQQFQDYSTQLLGKP